LIRQLDHFDCSERVYLDTPLEELRRLVENAKSEFDSNDANSPTSREKYVRYRRRRRPEHPETVERNELLQRLDHFEKRGWRCPQRVSTDTSLEELRFLVILAEKDDHDKQMHELIRQMQRMANVCSDIGLENLEKSLKRGEMSDILMPILFTKGFAAMDSEVLKRLWDQYQEIPFARSRKPPNDDESKNVGKRE